MQRIKQSVLILMVVVIAFFGFYLGLNLFKDSYATDVSKVAEYYRYVNRFQSKYLYNYHRNGDVNRTSSKSDIGFMRLSAKDERGSEISKLNVYCGLRGKHLSTSINFYRYNFDEFYKGNSIEWRKKLSNIVALYIPDKTPIEDLKLYLKTNYSQEYTRFGLANLTKEEAAAAFQTAVWTFTNGDTDYVAKTNDKARNIRLDGLHSILLQKNGYLKNVNGNISSINFTLNNGFYLKDDKYIISLKTDATKFNKNKDKLTLIIKTNNNTIIPQTAYTINYVEESNNIILNIAFDSAIFGQNDDGKLILASNNEVIDTIYISANVLHGETNKTVFVYKSKSSSYQNFVGSEAVPVTSNSHITVIIPSFAKVSIEVDKVDEENLSGHSLVNAHLALYRVQGGNDILIAEWLTTKTNKLINDLVPGTYKIIETLYPEGYENSTSANSVDGENIYVSSGKEFVLKPAEGAVGTVAKYYIHVKNKPTEIKIKKVDESGNNFVSGALFSIIDSDGGEYYRFESTNDAVSIKNELEVGNYFLVELESPTNYIKSDKVYRFTVGTPLPEAPTTIVDGPYKDAVIEDALYDSRTKMVSIKNKKGISISKKSLVDNAVYVIGATLTIKNSSGEVVDTWVTTAKDHIVTKELPDGDYTLTETIPAPGYATAESIPFTIASGKVINNVNLNMKDAPLKVCIAKKSTNTAGNIPGAEFELYDSENNLITKFVSEKDVYCAPVGLGLKPGTYKIKEVKAPKGYKGIGEKSIVITDTPDLQLFEVVNEIEVPKTSLNASNVIYIAVLIMGVTGMGLVCYNVKKYNY